MESLNAYQILVHNLLIEYATKVFIVKGGAHASPKTANDYTASMERYLPKEAKNRFCIEFPNTAYDVLNVNRLQEIHDLIEENPEWKEYDRVSHGSTFRGGLKCLIALKNDLEFLKSKGAEQTLLNPIYYQTINDNYSEDLREGKSYESHSVKYERNPRLRAMCISHFGCKCYVCGFDFKEHYGELGDNFIEVHHLTPLSELKEEHITSPIEGMVPLCSNCHSMVHRTNPPVEIDKLKELYK